MSAAPECGRMVSGGLMSYRCTLPVSHYGTPEGDPEPCLAEEAAGSKRLHAAWVERRANPLLVMEPCPNCGSPFNWAQAQKDGKTACCGAEVSEGMMGDTSHREPTKQRPGDQDLPSGGQRCVQDSIIAEMEKSKAVGIERYGSALMTFNGRRGIQDVKEEARDLYVYASMLEMMAEATLPDLKSAVFAGLRDAFGDNPSYPDMALDAIADPIVTRVLDFTTTAAVDIVFRKLNSLDEEVHDR